jgi:hypothetical protein
MVLSSVRVFCTSSLMCACCEAIMASCGAEDGVDGNKFGILERIDMLCTIVCKRSLS